MDIIDQATILRFHQDRTAAFGRGTCGALGWKNPDSQRLRFEALCEIADLNDRSVLDVGCGHGDLRAHLAEKYPRAHYTGIDHSAAFLEVASERYGSWPNTRFLLGDFSSAALPAADYLLASGVFSYRSREPDFPLGAIARMFRSARCGFGFNLLRRVEHPGGILAVCEPATVLHYCRQLTSNVRFRENYLEDDFTMFLYHD